MRKRKLGGIQQLVKRFKSEVKKDSAPSLEPTYNYNSPLVEHLIAEWSCGHLSAPAVQRLAQPAFQHFEDTKRPDLKCPSLQTLASLGNWG
eukprot:7932941-Karenia_brevis.AAC.1